jgi:hypothetical protein
MQVGRRLAGSVVLHGNTGKAQGPLVRRPCRKCFLPFLKFHPSSHPALIMNFDFIHLFDECRRIKCVLNLLLGVLASYTAEMSSCKAMISTKGYTFSRQPPKKPSIRGSELNSNYSLSGVHFSCYRSSTSSSWAWTLRQNRNRNLIGTSR